METPTHHTYICFLWWFQPPILLVDYTNCKFYRLTPNLGIWKRGVKFLYRVFFFSPFVKIFKMNLPSFLLFIWLDCLRNKQTYTIYTFSWVRFLQNLVKMVKKCNELTACFNRRIGILFKAANFHFQRADFFSYSESSAWVWVWMRAVQGALFELVFEDCRRRGAQTQLYLFNHTHFCHPVWGTSRAPSQSARSSGTIQHVYYYWISIEMTLLRWSTRELLLLTPGFLGLTARWPAEPHTTSQTCSFTSPLRTWPKRRWSILGAFTRLF